MGGTFQSAGGVTGSLAVIPNSTRQIQHNCGHV